MQVRPAVVADADRIAAVNAAGWRAGFRGLIGDAYLKAYDGQPRLRRATLADPGSDDIQLVAVAGDVIIGWISGSPADEGDLGPTAYLVQACYVDPDHWRTGVGRRLMASLIDRLDPSRWTHVVLWTLRDAARTSAFYVSLGMVRDGREAMLDRGGDVPVVRFSAPLERMRTVASTTGRPEGRIAE